MVTRRTLSVIKHFVRWSAFAVVLLVGASAAFGQETATILGTVKDASGAAVAGTNITARNTGTQQSRAATTDSDGSYRIPGLFVGSYEVRAEHEGFQAAVRTGLVLTVDLQAVVNITLQIGSVSQTVEVTGEAPLVDTTTSSLGGLVDSQKISELPLNGRNYIDLSLAQVGIAEQKTGTHNVGYVGDYVVSNGATVRSNNYLLDGANMTNAWGVSSASVTNSTLGVDGIREYKVVTNAVKAEYGMTAGSQMLMVSKSGTNSIHGDVFEYLRNSSLDAKNPFDTPASSAGKRLPEFQRNNFGASVGGPIRKNKIFFDSVYEGLRQSLGITETANVLPPDCMITNPGTFTLTNAAACVKEAPSAAKGLLPGATVPAVEQALFAFAQQFPYNQITSTGVYQYSNVFKQPAREDYGQMRVDENLSDKDNLFERWTVEDSSQPIATLFPGWGQSAVDRTQFITISEDHIFSPAVLNTVRAHFSRTSFYWHWIDPANAYGPTAGGTATGVTCIPSLPACGLGISGYSTPSSANARRHKQNLFTQSDDLFYTRGKNSFKFGGLMNEYLQVITNGGGCCGSQSFTGASITNFFKLSPTSFGANFGPSYERTYKYNTFGVYAQDDYRLTSRLTLNLGLRYEFETTPYEAHGEWSVIKDLALDKDYTVSRYVDLNPTLRNFSPRFGFAWDVMGDGKTAIRGGIAQLFDIGGITAFLLQTQNSTPPYSQRLSVTCNPAAVLPNVDPCAGFTLPLVFPTTGSGSFVADSLAPRPTDWNMRQTRILEYNFTVERQLPFNMALSVAYAGSRGYNLANTQEGNPVVPQGVPGPNGTCVPIAAGQTPNTKSMEDDSSATACWLPTDASGTVPLPPITSTVGYGSRINKNFGTMDLFTDRAHSWYNSLQVSLIKRLSHGLQFQSAYTWSKSIDEQAGAAFAENTNSQAADGDDTFNINNERGPTVFDIGQVWKFNLTYTIPTGVHSEGVASKLVNGWRLSSIVSLQTGYPTSPGLNVERSQSGVEGATALVDRLNYAPGRNPYNITHGTSPGCTYKDSANNTQVAVAQGTPLGTQALWYDPCGFTIPDQGFLGTVGRNTIRGPGFQDLDFSVSKNTALRFLGEGGGLEFRAEIFNVLNHANFALPSRTVYSGTLPASSNKAVANGLAETQLEAPFTGAGLISATVSNSRQVQLALKVLF
jgi:hypothetical protein